MSLEEITTGVYRTDETRSLDGQFRSLLDLDQKVLCSLGRMEYERIALQLIMRSRDLGYFVGIATEHLKKLLNMESTTYDQMMAAYDSLKHLPSAGHDLFASYITNMAKFGYIKIDGTIKDTQIIIPTARLLEYTHTLPKN